MMKNEYWWRGQSITDYEFRLMNKQELTTHEPFLTEGFRRTWGNRFSEDAVEVAKNKIEKGALLVILIRKIDSNDGRPAAFMTIKFISEEGVCSLVVEDGYTDENRRDEILIRGLEYCKVFAKAVGAERVEFSSERKGWKKVAPRIGYQYEASIDGRDYYSTGA